MIMLLSGGIDSTVMLYHALDLGNKDILGLFIDYGQRNFTGEHHAVHNICKKLHVTYHHIQVPTAFSYSNSSCLAHGNELYPGTVEELLPEGKFNAFVPNRNMLLISIASGVAMAYGHSEVWCGFIKLRNADVFFDQSPLFIDGISKILSPQGITVKAPLNSLYKEDVIKLGVTYGVDFNDTWTCYSNEERSCRVCSACIARDKSFKVARGEL